MIIKKNKKEIFKSDSTLEIFDFLMNGIKISNFKCLTEESSKNIESFVKENTILNWKEATSKFSKIFNKHTSQQIGYWLDRGWTEEEAKTMISSNSKKASKKANDAIQEMKKDSEKWNKFIETRTTSLQYYLNKGFSEEEAKEKLKERQTTFSKEKLSSLHGDEEAEKILNERNSKWLSSLKANNDWEDLSKRKTSSLEKMIKKYGEELGREKWNKKILICRTSNTFRSFISKYGIETGTEKWNDRLNKILIKSGKASKESLLIFKPLLAEFQSKFECYLGFENLNEWFIWDNTLKKRFSFDFTLREPKIIIEFHGEAFHPNKNRLTEEEWNNWKSPFSKISANEAMTVDQHKKKLAEENGFKVLELWSSTSVEENIEIARKFIFENS